MLTSTCAPPSIMQRALCSQRRLLLQSRTHASHHSFSHFALASHPIRRSFATTTSVDGIPTITVQDAQKEIKEVCNAIWRSEQAPHGPYCSTRSAHLFVYGPAYLSQFDYVVDVREDDEIAHGVIDGAYHIPLGQIIRDVDKPAVQKLKGKQVLVYCKAGRRSAMACQLLNDRGFKATNLEGGYTAWLKAPDTSSTEAKRQ